MSCGKCFAILASMFFVTAHASKPDKYLISFQRIENAIELYYSVCRFYPTNLDEILHPEHCKMWANKKPLYKSITAAVMLDPWNRKYQYTYPVNTSLCYEYEDYGESHEDIVMRKRCPQYRLFSYGEDAIAGTEDDLVNWKPSESWRYYYHNRH